MKLDVRTYILLVILSATWSTMNSDIIVELCIMSGLVLLQLFSEKGSFMPKLILIYAVFCIVQYVLFPIIPDGAQMILSMFVVNVRSFFPVVMCIVLLYKNTRVSEMTASFTRMGISRKVTVPVAVAIRYIPSLKEEWLHIRDAMRMRSVTRGIKNPFVRLAKRAECYLVPLFISSLQNADDLASAAVTRGIENPDRPTCRNYRPMGIKDYITLLFAFLITAFCFVETYLR